MFLSQPLIQRSQQMQTVSTWHHLQYPLPEMMHSICMLWICEHMLFLSDSLFLANAVASSLLLRSPTNQPGFVKQSFHPNNAFLQRQAYWWFQGFVFVRRGAVSVVMDRQIFERRANRIRCQERQRVSQSVQEKGSPSEWNVGPARSMARRFGHVEPDTPW